MILAAWTVFGLLHATFWILTTSLSPDADVPMPPGLPLRHILGLVATALLLAWTWAALTPLIFRLTAFASPARIGWIATMAMHAGAFLAIASGTTALRHALLPILTGEPPTGLTFLSRLVFLLDVQLFTYLAVVLTGRAIASHRRYVDRALRAHVLETQLARAQLHFLLGKIGEDIEPMRHAIGERIIDPRFKPVLNVGVVRVAEHDRQGAVCGTQRDATAA